MNKIYSKNSYALRIIAGKWRGRKIKVSSSLAIRPTQDRIRETLFNWLSSYIVDAKCLDLFAGSGILSVEALSRGASDVTSIDSSNQSYQHLTSLDPEFGKNLQCINADAIQWIKTTTHKYDIIFLDPPYDNNLIPECLKSINRILSDNAIIYFEGPKKLDFILEPSLELWRDATTGNKRYGLLKRR